MRIITQFQTFIVLCAMTLALAGCTPDEPLDDPSKNPTEQPGQTPEDGPTDKPDNPETPEDPEIPVDPETPVDPEIPEDKPAEKYVRLTLTSDENNDNLTFEWEGIDLESVKTNSLSFFVSDGEKPIYGKPSHEEGAPDNKVAYSGVAVTPHEGDGRSADFQTVDYYDISKFASPSYCYVAAGARPDHENITTGQGLFHIEMPSSFVQASNGNPDFLKEHMSMYASAVYDQNGTVLDFKQVPAVFKFILRNSTAGAIVLQEVSLGASFGTLTSTKSSGLPTIDDNLIFDETPHVASTSADMSFDWTNGKVQLAFAEDGYKEISVLTGNGVSLNDGETFTAYSAALPLSDNNAFADKVINISVKVNDFEYVAVQIDPAELAEMNAADIYNWISGKTYTIEIDINKL